MFVAVWDPVNGVYWKIDVQTLVSGVTPDLDPTLQAIAALTPTTNQSIYFTGTDAAAVYTLTPYARTLLDDVDTIAARATLGLTPGVDVQAFDAELAAIAALSSSANQLPYFTGAGTAALTTLSAFIRTLLDDPDAATARGTLGLVIGTNVQAFDAELNAIAGLVSAADQLPYFTGSGTAALTTLSSFIRTLLDDVDAATARGTLGLVIGTNVQAFDATLASLAAYNTNGILVQTAPDTFTGRSIVASAGVQVQNGSGVVANPAVSLDINGLTEDTTPDAANDFVASYDASATGHKKIRLSNLPGGGGGGASITVSDTAPGSPTSGALWFDSVGGLLYLWYVDPNTSQWVNVNNFNSATPIAPQTFAPQGRATLTSGVPVLTSSVSAATNVFYTPSVGKFVPIFNGSVFTAMDTGGELSQLTTDTTKSPAAVAANKNYDLFGWLDGSTPRVTRGPAWSTDTTRGTGAGTSELVPVAGLSLNANAITNGPAAQRGTFLGTIRSNGSSQIDYLIGGSAANGSPIIVGVWNAFNRKLIHYTNNDSTASWTYASATWRAANGSTGNRISFVCGAAEDIWTAKYTGVGTNAASGFVYKGVGFDSTTTPFGFTGTNQVTSATTFANGEYWTTSLGFHNVYALELVSAGTGTIFGNTSNLLWSWLSFDWMA